MIPGESLATLSLPVKFIARLFPLEVFISSATFNMTYFDAVFHVQNGVFRPGKSLVVDFAVRHSESELRLAVWTLSLLDNESPELICTFIRNHPEIMIAHESKPIHCLVSVCISSQLDVSFEISGSIQSFDFLMMGCDGTRRQTGSGKTLSLLYRLQR
jgi:hypothetical protein